MAPQLKPLPDPNAPLDLWIDLVTHPEKNRTNHINFDDAARYPFQADATQLSRVNAWWLAEASLLSYWHDDDEVKTIYRNQTSLTCQPLSEQGTQCHVAANHELAIVAFRGTQPDQWQDIFDDARYGLVNWSHGRVHGGFFDALDRILGKLGPVLGALPPKCHVWFTGHSLGAALATLAADRYQDTAGVYTFGSPLVGDQIFAGHFNARFAGHSFRFVNDHDVVTHVPPEPFGLPLGLYTHVNERRWIDKDGNIGTTQPTLLHFVRDVFGSPLFLLHTLQGLMSSPGSVMPAALTDHAPILYVGHLWNDFARNHGR